jgi:hypothetical protein
MTPVKEEFTADLIPVGASVHHRRLGSGRTTAPGYVVGHWWYLPVEFGWPHFNPAIPRNCKVACVSVMPWKREVRYRLEVAGEFVAEGTQWALQTLADARVARLNAEWEAEQDQEPHALPVGSVAA